MEDRFVSGLDPRLEPPAEVRRFEVINGALGRRSWSSGERARILEETLVPGVSVSAVARRNGLTPQQLFTWRREAGKRLKASPPPAFVPAVIVPEAATEPAPVMRARVKRAPERRRGAAIAIDVDGAKVTIENGASPATIAAVIGALKAGS